MREGFRVQPCPPAGRPIGPTSFQHFSAVARPIDLPISGKYVLLSLPRRVVFCTFFKMMLSPWGIGTFLTVPVHENHTQGISSRLAVVKRNIFLRTFLQSF